MTHDILRFFRAAKVAVVVSDLTELVSLAFEPFGGLLLQGFQRLADEDFGWFIHQEVNVLGHEDAGVDAGFVAGAGLLEQLFNERLRACVSEEWHTAIAAEGDEMKGIGLLLPL